MNPVSSSSCTRSIPGTAPISTRGPLPPTPPRPMTRVQTAPAHPIASGAASLARTAQVAPALRDRNADIAHPTEPLASRKRKREEASLSPLDTEIGVIFSNATGVGFMVIGQSESESAQEDFMNARSEFIERTGSDQNIRIRIAHNAQGFRGHLDALWTAETLQTIRTALDLPTERTDAQIREVVTMLLMAQRETELHTMAAGWGSVDPLINLPHGALHVSQAGLDVFQAPPTFDLPANLIEVPQAQQD